MRFHDLRHTCASLLIARRRQLQVMLGHSSVALTFDVDGHDEPLADALDGFYRESDDDADVIQLLSSG